MDIDRFLAKPVEVEIQGEKVMIKPLTTEFYPLIQKLAYYSQKVLTAKRNLKKGDELRIEDIFTPEEIEKQSEIESEVAFRTMRASFEGVTKEVFSQMSVKVIREIMEGAAKANGLTDEKLEEIKNILTKDDK